MSKVTVDQSKKSFRVLVQTRPNVFTQRGGDTVVLERFVTGLRERGYVVEVDAEGRFSPNDFDLVHLFNFATPTLTGSQATEALRCQTPYVVTSLYEETAQFHSQSHYIAGRLVDYVEAGQKQNEFSISYRELAAIPDAKKFEVNEVARHAHAILPNGVSEGRAIKRDFPFSGPIRVVPVGIDPVQSVEPSRFEQTYGVKGFVLCVGRIESRKNQLMLLKALEDSELPIVLVGGGFSYQPEYDRAVRNFQRRGQTIILDRLNEQMLASAYAACAIHVLPSWFELPGLVSLEAAARGKNVVVTRTGTTSDYLGDKGFYCLPWDADSIRSAVYAAYYSPVQAGIVEHVAQYTWENAVDTLDRVYREILQESVVETVRSEQLKPRDTVVDVTAVKSPAQDIEGIDTLLDQGESAARRGEFDSANQLLRQAESISPDSARMLKARGAVLLAQMDPISAIPYFDRALAIDAEDVKVLTGRGMCDLVQEQYPSALTFFARALELQPDYLVALHQLLDSSYKLKRYDVALEYLRRYLAVMPGDNNIHFCLAGCLFKAGQVDKALEELRELEAVNPSFKGIAELRKIAEATLVLPKETPSPSEPMKEQVPSVGYVSPDVQESLQELSKAMAAWKVAGASEVHASKQECTDGIAVSNALSMVEDYKRSKEFDKAETDLGRIIEAGIHDPTLRRVAECLRAELLVVREELMQADSIYDSILAEDPNMPRALCGKGALCAQSENWSSARQFFQRALEIDSECDIGYAGLGICAMVDGQVERAFELFETAAKKNPENQRALLGVLQTGYPLKRFNEMEQMLSSYLKLHPASIDMLYSLAGVLYAQGKVKEAKLEVEKILIFEPQHEHALELQEMIEEKRSIRDSEVEN